jgi:hypothetical protein
MECASSSYLASIFDHDHNPISGMAVSVKGDKEKTATWLTTTNEGSFFFKSPACSANATVTAYIDDATTATMEVKPIPYYPNSVLNGEGWARQVPHLVLDKGDDGQWALTHM